VTEVEWTRRAGKALVGRKIVAVRYMSDDEALRLGWYKRGLVILLDDGSHYFPSADDEGNDAGALFGTSDFPTLRRG
jgi:hypothetical protein